MVAGSLNNLSLVRHSLERLSEAEKVRRQALAMRRRLFNTPHVDTAQSLDNLALVRVLQNDPHEAEPLYREALAVYKVIFDGD